MPPARAELLADLDTGKVLTGANEHALLYPGSLTKMLTALIAVNWLPPNAVVPVSPEAAAVYPDKVGMKPGQVWPLPDALHALLIVSANDAAYAIAERVSGSLSGFAQVMSIAASEMGMSDGPALHDPAGLDGTEGFDGGNLMSAWDLATAARDLMANPTLRQIVSLLHYSFEVGGVEYSLANYNRYFLQSYPGAIGVKTGLTDRAGFCVAEAAERGGRTMLAVVLGGENSYQTAEMLLDEGFSTPASAEAASDPRLPAVVQPFPPPPPDPASSDGPSPGARSAASGAGAAVAVVAARSGGGGWWHYFVLAVGAAGIVVGVSVTTRRALRPRSKALHLWRPGSVRPKHRRSRW
jgi:D-alanyl-D-alanine carboxypeptidase (penicillin-binding protein 5/6)